MKLNRFYFFCFSVFLFSVPLLQAQEKTEAVILAVMPFRSVGDSVALNLGDAFSETLTTKLVGLKGLKVYERAQFQKVTGELSVQRDSADLFDKESVAKTGAVVSMDYMVVGSITLAGKQLSCQLRLVRVRDGQAILSQQFTGKYPGDIFALQDSMAMGVVKTLKINLNDMDKRRISKQPTKSMDSWELYNKSLGNLTALERIKLLEKALVADPTFIQADHLLADLYIETEQKEQAQRVYANILTLDPTDFRALYNSALLFYDSGDMKKARDQMQQCLSQKEGDPDVFFHLGLFSEFDDAGNRIGSSASILDAYNWYKKSLAIDPLHRESLEGSGMLGLILAQNSTDPQEQLVYLEDSQKNLSKYLELSTDPDATAETGEIEGALEQINSLIPQLQDYLNKRKKA